MKTGIIIFSMLFSTILLKAQFVVDTNWCLYTPTNQQKAFIDSSFNFCDSTDRNYLNFALDTGSNNIWQVGKTFKFGISDARDTVCNLMTDSISSYPINNYSSFSIVLPQRSSFSWNFYNYYVSFWHKFDTDSLRDGCWLEFSSDSGITWKPLDSLINLWGLVYSDYHCQLYANNSIQLFPKDTIEGGKMAWSGNSNGWKYTSFLLNLVFPVKPSRGTEINALRFVFDSDSIQNNKAGWMINNLSIGYINMFGGTNDYSIKNVLPISPNPSSSGIFTISYPSSIIKGNMMVYDINGKRIMEKPLSSTIDLSAFPNGLYYYKIAFDDKLYSGVLNKN